LQITETQPSSDQREQTTIEIEVDGRWDALALSELLVPFHSFLVQLDHERWVVHARAPSNHGDPLPDALSAIDDWSADRDPRSAVCRVGGRRYQLRDTSRVTHKPDHPAMPTPTGPTKRGASHMQPIGSKRTVRS
jgi:hypothetical protein